MQAAADGDMYEIQSSQLVLDAGGDDQELTDLAQRIIDDHTANSQRLAELAGAVGVEVPQQMSAGKQFKVEQLRALTGDQLVQAYLLQQELAHIDAIALYTAYAQLGQNEELRTFAQETLPVLEEHLQMVQSLRESRPDPAGQEGAGQQEGQPEGEQPPAEQPPADQPGGGEGDGGGEGEGEGDGGGG